MKIYHFNDGQYTGIVQANSKAEARYEVQIALDHRRSVKVKRAPAKRFKALAMVLYHAPADVVPLYL